MDSKTVAQASIAISGVLATGWAGSAAAADVGTFSKQAVAPASYGKLDPWNMFSLGFGLVGQTATSPTTLYDSWDRNQVYRITNSSGIGATIEIGKDFHPAGSPIVFGLYGDVKFGRQTGTAQSQYLKAGDSVSQDSSLQFTNGGTLAARLGFLANDKLLFYGLAGYSLQQYTARTTVSGYYSEDESKSGTLGGVTFGIGAELMLSGDISLKGEYRYTRLGAISVFGDSTYYESAKTSYGVTELQQLRVVLSKKWN